MISPENSGCVEQAAEIAREAGALVLRYFKRGVKTEYKGQGEVDLVTEADRASEKLIVERLRTIFPSHDIVGEEGTRTTSGAGEYRWYVDPLDGTTNFAHGFPVFCVSLGLERAPSDEDKQGQQHGAEATPMQLVHSDHPFNEETSTQKVHRHA